jgi:hypothetical protein
VPLSADEKKLLEELNRKSKEPDGPAAHRVNVTVDLGDDKQLARAKKLGLLGALFADDETDDTSDADGDPDDEAPKRRSYFNES